RVMESQALGVEIIIRGKLTTERSRFEKFRQGYLPRVGDPVLKSVKVAVADVQLKQGLFGIKVRILPPTVDFVDKPLMKTPPPPAPAQVQAPVEEPTAEQATDVENEVKEEVPVGNPSQA
ncbi:MAG TPA: 30S ribosomal protein S3, partial [Candidatus Bathyarchaeia archaeon]|nr:30S ribosomal protein S3 [Candidatus Bathyarchaeia archaeon]